jgi:PAS domain S-box-containing protein
MKTDTVNKTKEQLIAENEELLSRLAETEDALLAIRTGEVDAIVVSGMNGEQVYSISSAETPYRTFVEEMNEGAATLSKEGIILYCNRRFVELVGKPIESVIGSNLNRFIALNDKSKFDQLLLHQSLIKKNVLLISLINSLFLKLSFHLLPAYLQGEHCIMIATDISDLKKKENELLELHSKLQIYFKNLQGLRIDLINAKIESDMEKNKLKITNNKLLKEIAKLKILEAGLKQKIKLSKSKI